MTKNIKESFGVFLILITMYSLLIGKIFMCFNFLDFIYAIVVFYTVVRFLYLSKK